MGGNDIRSMGVRGAECGRGNRAFQSPEAQIL